MAGPIARLIKGGRMSEHYHSDITHIFITTVGVVVAIHMGRFVASWMIKANAPALQAAGKAVSGVLTFS